jgi:hypothetical protein
MAILVVGAVAITVGVVLLRRKAKKQEKPAKKPGRIVTTPWSQLGVSFDITLCNKSD